MRKVLIGIVGFLVSCGYNGVDKAYLVDPFIGTSGHGHVFPGATTPFGMVQVSPDTGTEGWDWCSGYHNSDRSIIGFSHTHLSGTGGGDLGDILLMPAVGKVLFDAGTKEDPNGGYRSRFSHDSEKAYAGFYSVFLEDPKVEVELTASPRAAYHKYTYKGDRNTKHVMVDLIHGIQDNVELAQLVKLSPSAIGGFRRSKGWADDHAVFYYIEFSAPIAKIQSRVDGIEVAGDSLRGKNVVSAISFKGEKNSIEAKVGLSYVDVAGAKNNMLSEIGSLSFDQTLDSAVNSWNKALSVIEVEGGMMQEAVVFYTSLYHTMIAPYLMSDVDGRYISSDRNVYTDTTMNNYGLFSLWDTFRALHPLLNLIEPEKNMEFVNSLVRYYQQSGRLPVWDLNMRETNCMIGYHAIPVIADAYMKGNRSFNADTALKAMLKSATQDQYAGVGYYRQFGYLPMDKENNSASKAVEYAYDDWCIAMMAKEMGREDVYNEYIKRAQYYKNHIDPKDGFVKGRDSHGRFREKFAPTDISILGQGDFTEGNSWHYSFFVPQDVNGHIDLLGGDSAYVAKLDELFSSQSVTADHSPDVTGLIGNYAHGNEPSHHVAYLYSYAGKPWRTQEMVAKIKSEMYTAQRDGLCGNEDCGQMSAWYVFSAMGFYPVTPAANIYVLGNPSFRRMTINLIDGKEFVVSAKNFSAANIYIDSVSFNGVSYTKSYISHDMISGGGELILHMSSTPNKNFGVEVCDRPVAKIANSISSETLLSEVVFEPYLDTKQRIFADFIEVEPKQVGGTQVVYTLDNSEPSAYSAKATGKIQINGDKILKIRAVGKEGRLSSVGTYKFYKGLLKDVVTGTQPRTPYVNGGLAALTDSLMGGDGYKNIEWIGYVDTTVVLKSKFEPKVVSKVGFNAVNSVGAWVLLPFGGKATAYLNGEMVAEKEFDIPNAKDVPEGAYFFDADMGKVKADEVVWTIVGGKLPDWHTSKGKGAWMFIDEVTIY